MKTKAFPNKAFWSSLPRRLCDATLSFRVACAFILLCCAGTARSQEEETRPVFALSGYGTLGIAHSSDNNSDFTANVITPGNAGYSRRWTAGVDSRLGMQLDVQLAPAWTAVLQVVSEPTLRGGYRPSVEWANLKYDLTPDLSARIGRIAEPLFLAGDYRKIAYALPWARPPIELYGSSAISNSTGLDTSYRWHVDEIHNVTQAFVGGTSVFINPESTAKVRELRGISNTTIWGYLTVRASAMRASLTVDLARELFNGFRQFGTQGAAIASRYDLNPKTTTVGAIGFSYDPGPWFLMAEASRINTRSYFGDKGVGYISAGYRQGNLTPYATYAVSRAGMDPESAGLDLSQFPEPMAASGAKLNQALQHLFAVTVPRQHSASAGIRWDWRVNYALKLQYDRLTPQPGSTGTFINVQPGFKAGIPISVISAAVDFVF